MSDLVNRLSQNDSHVEVTVRPEKTARAFKECLDRGYVHIKFTETRGGTELGIRVDPERTDLASADFDGGTGHATIVGDLTLDYVPVRCTARVELSNLTGQGRLEPRMGELDAAVPGH